MTDRRARIVSDAGGPCWEKRGNAVWLRCPDCAAWYPAAPAMLAAEAPPCVCPRCHAQFRPGGDAAAG